MIVPARAFDPVADVLEFTITGIEDHGVYFKGGSYWLIVGFTDEGIANIEILDAVYRVFGEKLPLQAQVDHQTYGEGGAQWRFGFFDEPVVLEIGEASDNGTWHARAMWNDTSHLVGLIITRLANKE